MSDARRLRGDPGAQVLKDAGGGRSEAELLAAFGCGVELFFFFFFSGSLFSLDSLFLSLLKLERASLASSSLSLYNHAEPRSPEATAAAADGRLASQRYGISIADEAFFGGSLSLSLVTLSQPSLDSHLFLPHSTTRTNSLWRGPRRGRLGSPGACLRRAR